MQKIVITGGPSIGKTTVIEILAARGYSTVPEAARIVIEEETIKGTDSLPWGNRAKFQELVFKKQLTLEAEASRETVFIDRGILDGVAYCKYANVPVPPAMYTLEKNRYDKIFILNSLGIYEEDGIRSRTLEDAEKLHQLIEEVYEEFGYQPIAVPVLPPEDRVNFILEKI